MRVAEVIGTVTLSRRLEDIPPGRFLIVRPQSGAALRNQEPALAEPVVAYDEISAGLGSQAAISEGREAAMPFHPQRVPIDAYCAAILDTVHVNQDA